MRSAVVMVAAVLALAGCLLTDDTFTRLALVAGVVGIAVVLIDLARPPHQPCPRAGQQKLSP